MSKNNFTMSHHHLELMRAKEVCAALKISSATLWRWRTKGGFPKPIQIGERVQLWKVKDIEQWIYNCEKDRGIK